MMTQIPKSGDTSKDGQRRHLLGENDFLLMEEFDFIRMKCLADLIVSLFSFVRMTLFGELAFSLSCPFWNYLDS